MDPYKLHHSEHCRICGNRALIEYLDLGVQPPSDRFITAEEAAHETAYPLRVRLCPECGLSQLRDHLRFDDMIADYLYRTTSSKALCRELAALAGALADEFGAPGGETPLVVDIGCNDGVLLSGFDAGRFRRLGVEPAAAGEDARRAGIEVIAASFDRAFGRDIAARHGAARIVAATNVLNYLDDIAGFAEGVAALLAKDGVFVAEFAYLRDLVDDGTFDTIYHEHILYLSLTPLVRLLDGVGMRAFRVRRCEIGPSGPALRVYACHADADHADDGSVRDTLAEEAAWGVADAQRYAAFAARCSALRETLLAMLAGLRRDGARIGAFGAPAKGNTLLNYLGLTHAEIAAAADANPDKLGRLTPGSHIPIVDDAAFLAMGFTHALLLSWNYLDFFLENAEFARRGGRFIVPFPEPAIRP